MTSRTIAFSLVGLAGLCQLLIASGSLTGVLERVVDVVRGGDSGVRTSKALRGMKQKLQHAQEDLYDEIYSNYGEYTHLLFNRTEIMADLVITSATGTNRSSISIHRLKRRIKRKIMEGLGSGRDAMPFVWVTSGNSVAAGHGNLLHQSYTGVLERAITPAFAAVGLALETRLRAYSGIWSAPEVALCMESYFGTNVDILGWDFALTDNRDTWRYRVFANRAGLMPSMPTIVMLSGPAQLQIGFELEQHGQAVLGMVDHNPLRRRIPDSLEHPNPAELPPAVQYFLCKGSEITPPCNNYKYNGTPCEEVGKIRGRANWHPGWRDAMLRGYVYSLFLAEVLDQTLDELIGEVGMAKENSLLARFIREESTDSSAFLRSFPLYDEAGIANFGEDLYPILLRGNALCHSMRQPSQARCEGLVDGIEGISAKTLGKCENRDHYTFETLPDTVRRALLPTLHDSLNPHNNSFSIGDSVEADWEMRGKYYEGEVIASTSGEVTVKYFDDESVETLDVRFVRLSQQITLDSTLTTGGESLVPRIKAPWMVASDNDWRHSCNVTVAHDFADSFVVRYSDGWMGDIYPNERLKKAYDNEMERRGLVIMCERAYTHMPGMAVLVSSAAYGLFVHVLFDWRTDIDIITFVYCLFWDILDSSNPLGLIKLVVPRLPSS